MLEKAIVNGGFVRAIQGFSLPAKSCELHKAEQEIGAEIEQIRPRSMITG